MKENSIGVIGSGSWATAIILILLERAGRTVNWWVRNAEMRQAIAATGRNPKHLPAATLDTERLRITGDLDALVAESQLIFLAIPSAFIGQVLKQIDPERLKDKQIVSAIKGSLPRCNSTVSQFLTEQMGVQRDNICVISGPTHAEEVCQRKPTFITMASSNPALARLVADEMRCPFLHTAVSADIGGIETTGLLKNIYAIGAGICQGLGYGDNMRAVTVVASAKELISILDTYKPAYDRITNAYSYTGDLMVTCWSEHSRNRALGQAIAQGETVEQVFARTGAVAEGYYNAAIMQDHIVHSGHEGSFPIVESIYGILYNGADPRKTMEYLINNVF